MDKDSKELLDKIYNSVLEGNKEEVKKLAQHSVRSGYDPYLVINRGLIKGIGKLGELWEEGSCFLPELVLGAEAVKTGISVLQKNIFKDSPSKKSLPRIIIGTIEGDIHDIGKTLVATMLSANGFEVIDLGVDVKSEVFVNMTKKYQPKFLCISSLLTTTMQNEVKVIEGLKKANLRKKLKVMVGGAPASQDWADEIGADFYGENAISAVRIAQKELKYEKKGR